MKSTTIAPVIFFERHDTYRSWPYVFIMLVFGTAPLIPLMGVVAGEWSGDDLFGVIFGTLWLLATLGLSGFLAWRIFVRPGHYSRIDEQGIQVNSKRWKWDEIKRVYTTPAMGHAYLTFQAQAFSGIDHAIHHYPPLRSEEANAILHQLHEYLSVHYPAIDIG